MPRGGEGGAVASRQQQGGGCGNGCCRADCESGSQKSKGLDQISFTQHRTGHSSEGVDTIKNADGAAKLRALQKGIFHQHRQG